MTQTFFFYDLETFGLNPKEDRIAQFAGIRTDHHFNIIGEPINLYCQPPEDYIPDPESILITGITPQEAMEKGITEAAFAKAIHQEFSQPGTCILGYNNIRFDDEMIRYLFYRNFYDPYAYSWQNNNSRWDLLDVVRATYAFRPEGIKWPQNDHGEISLKLEHLSKANELLHEKAHDALSDVYATIGMAKLIQEQQPRLFDFYFAHRRARDLQHLIDFKTLTPLLHVSGMFGQIRKNLSIVMPITTNKNNRNELIMIDLMADITPLLTLDATTIRQKLYTPSAELPPGEQRIPIKTLFLNKCPILAPLGIAKTLPEDVINPAFAQENYEILLQHRQEVTAKIEDVFQRETTFENNSQNAPVETLLYHGFFEPSDRRQMNLIPQMDGDDLRHYDFTFHDERAMPLLFIYRARNFPETLDEQECIEWNHYTILKREYFKNKYQEKFQQLYRDAEQNAQTIQLATLKAIEHFYQ